MKSGFNWAPPIDQKRSYMLSNRNNNRFKPVKPRSFRRPCSLEHRSDCWEEAGEDRQVRSDRQMISGKCEYYCRLLLLDDSLPRPPVDWIHHTLMAWRRHAHSHHSTSKCKEKKNYFFSAGSSGPLSDSDERCQRRRPRSRETEPRDAVVAKTGWEWLMTSASLLQTV